MFIHRYEKYNNDGERKGFGDSRLKHLSGKEFSKILEKKVWVLKRIRGKHHIYIK
jgi:hypothetical protein